ENSRLIAGRATLTIVTSVPTISRLMQQMHRISHCRRLVVDIYSLYLYKQIASRLGPGAPAVQEPGGCAWSWVMGRRVAWTSRCRGGGGGAGGRGGGGGRRGGAAAGGWRPGGCPPRCAAAAGPTRRRAR